MRHIFHPTLKAQLDPTNQTIEKFVLEGFHHDEYNFLEKSGTLQWKNKVYGNAEYGAEECFMAEVDFGHAIICKVKTYFSSSWSREKTVRTIFEAFKNRIEDISEIGSPNKKFLCQYVNLFIEMVIDSKNKIISAYPSLKNF